MKLSFNKGIFCNAKPYINHLIIEDDKDIREGIRILLEGEGFTVTEAENGMDGLNKRKRLVSGWI